jgi:hypothetical protein
MQRNQSLATPTVLFEFIHSHSDQSNADFFLQFNTRKLLQVQ